MMLKNKYRVTMENFFKQGKNIVLIILGSLLISLFIYFTFIRKRLPKEIPFTLTEFSFLILAYICCAYIYMVKQTLYPKPLNDFLGKFMTYLKHPFIYLDSSIKNNKYIFPLYNKKLNQIINKLDNWNHIDRIFYLYVFQIIPRIILLTIFMIDVFILHNIRIFYYFIVLGVFPILYRYCKYSLEFALEQYIKYLEDKYDSVWVLEEYYDDINWKQNPNAIYHDKTVTIRKYIEIKYITLTNYDDKEDYFDYTGIPYAKDDVYNNCRAHHNKTNTELSADDYKIIEQDFHEIMPKILQLYPFIICNNQTSNRYYIPTFKIIIYFGYLISWLYILLISFHTIKNFGITFQILSIIINNYKIFLIVKVSLLYLGIRFINKRSNNQHKKRLAKKLREFLILKK